MSFTPSTTFGFGRPAFGAPSFESQNNLNALLNRAKKITTPFAILEIYVPEHLKAVYQEAVEYHNHKMDTNRFPDSGFDLFVPNDVILTKDTHITKIDFEINCQMFTYNFIEGHISNITENVPTAFFLLPRSSISKKPLMLANSMGLIDSGYRGSLMSVFRCFLDDVEEYKIEKNERIMQIVHPSTYRIFVRIVDNVSLLNTTERYFGGFGSTGR